MVTVHLARLAPPLRVLPVDKDATVGFTPIERSKAPAQIQATSQFRSLSQKSAVCAVRDEWLAASSPVSKMVANGFL
jgi:hypothetical protein